MLPLGATRILAGNGFISMELASEDCSVTFFIESAIDEERR
jgi:hypothetical protein